MHSKRAQVAQLSIPLRSQGWLFTGLLPMMVSALIVALMSIGATVGGAQSAHSSSAPPGGMTRPSSVLPTTTMSAAFAPVPQLAGYSALPMQADPEPADVVEGYFSAINDGDYVAAWALGGRNIVGGRYDDFVESFTDTANDEVTVNSVVGETVEVELDATQSDGSHRFFVGTYTVRNGVIIDADVHRE